jgi:hypothetical protein
VSGGASTEKLVIERGPSTDGIAIYQGQLGDIALSDSARLATVYQNWTEGELKTFGNKDMTDELGADLIQGSPG